MSSQEQQFTIQPHPAKTNNPADLTGGPQSGCGLDSQSGARIFHARDPHIPSEDIVKGLEQPKTREELHARAAELNKGK
ncbi:hypothetical protein BJV78DRAFT_1184735 [Lactifluus subvellereus]|nr:hypothetical protein BJV78DRAFT_1184735 [Lactifluus subvellereus]